MSQAVTEKKELNILIVEDEVVIAQFIWDSLEFLGYTPCAMLTNGEDALQYIRDNDPDLVLMDIKIEGSWDGIETARKIWSEKQIPVVYLTAFDDEDTLENALSTLPYGYIVKPFSQNDLRIVINLAYKRIYQGQNGTQTGKDLNQSAKESDENLDGHNGINEINEKHHFSNLSGLDMDKILNQIEKLLNDEKIYKDSELSLGGFAQMLEITKHQLSEILNKKLEKSFYNLLKEFRIQEAKNIIQQDPDRRMIYVALEAGFKKQF